MTMRKLAISSVILLLSAGSAPAPIWTTLPDDCDDVGIVWDVKKQKDVMQSREKLNGFKKKLYPLKEKDFIALFGKAQDKLAKAYAMPAAQDREVLESGIYVPSPPSKGHTEFYVIKDVAAVEVGYNRDGESPKAVVIYFPTDKDFPKLTYANVAKRLAWDEDHLKKLLANFEQRMVEVYPWEIDQKELAKFHEGDFAVDAKVKLEAWIESGKKLGYDYRHKEGSNNWYWYRPDGKLARRASGARNDGPPDWFICYHEDGVSNLRKEESFRSTTGELLTYRQWYQPKNPFRIRVESASAWCWYGKDGKAIHAEWDDNGDGIPDWYMTKEDNLERGFYFGEQKKGKPLKIENSWAINPKLIPEESRISDQPELRVPIRRKVADKPVKK
jgi:hypothetical protein